MLWVVLIACAVENPCDAYVDALVACVEAGGGSTADVDRSEVCGQADEEQADRHAEWYACQREAYAGADCSTEAGRLLAAQAATQCVPPASE